MSIGHKGSGKTGQGPRLALAACITGLALCACTTVEGTNAFVSPATFEREVMRPTLVGVGLVPREEKPAIEAERGPLVIPGAGAVPPPPSQSTAALPLDSTQPYVVR